MKQTSQDWKEKLNLFREVTGLQAGDAHSLCITQTERATTMHQGMWADLYHALCE